MNCTIFKSASIRPLPAGRNLHQSATKGFSLIELVVAMGIFAVAVTMATAVFVTINRLNTRGVAVKDAQQNARLAMEEISRVVRISQKITVSGSGSLRELEVDVEDVGKVKFSVNPASGVLEKTDLTTGIKSSVTSNSVIVEELKFEEISAVPAILNIYIKVIERNPAYGTGEEYEVELKSSVVLRGQY